MNRIESTSYSVLITRGISRYAPHRQRKMPDTEQLTQYQYLSKPDTRKHLYLAQGQCLTL